MYNKIIIAGNLGKDPELRYTPTGQAVVNLNVATNEIFTDASGQRQERTIWWRVAVWGKQAEIVNQYLTRGQKVLVEGRMNADPQTGGPRIYTKQDGTAGASFEVTAQTIRFLSAKGEGSSAGGHGGVSDFDSPPPSSLDDIPF